jgi:hypothetical protein
MFEAEIFFSLEIQESASSQSLDGKLNPFRRQSLFWDKKAKQQQK